LQKRVVVDFLLFPKDPKNSCYFYKSRSVIYLFSGTNEEWSLSFQSYNKP
jgi:hypothetical protein